MLSCRTALLPTTDKREERRGGEKRGEGRGEAGAGGEDRGEARRWREWVTLALQFPFSFQLMLVEFVPLAFLCLLHIFALFASATVTTRLLTNGEIVGQGSGYPLGNWTAFFSPTSCTWTHRTLLPLEAHTSESHSQFHPWSSGTAMSPTPDLGKGPPETRHLKELHEL